MQVMWTGARRFPCGGFFTRRDYVTSQFYRRLITSLAHSSCQKGDLQEKCTPLLRNIMIPTTATGTGSQLLFAFPVTIRDVCRLLENAEAKTEVSRRKTSAIRGHIFFLLCERSGDNFPSSL